MVFTPGKKKFIELLDTPNSYAGFADYFVKVKSTEDGLEFAEVSAAGGGIPYRIVAASDASDESKAKAHYVCDGSNDQEEIYQAMSDLPDSGGIVFLTEGTFYWSSKKLFPGKNIILTGSGVDATIIETNMSDAVFYLDDNTKYYIVRDITFHTYAPYLIGSSSSAPLKAKKLVLYNIRHYLKVSAIYGGILYYVYGMDVPDGVWVINSRLEYSSDMPLVTLYSAPSTVQKIYVLNSTLTNGAIFHKAYSSIDVFLINSVTSIGQISKNATDSDYRGNNVYMINSKIKNISNINLAGKLYIDGCYPSVSIQEPYYGDVVIISLYW